MPYILDLLIAVIVVVCVVRGAKKGFIRAAFGIISFLLAAVLAFLFYSPFSNYVMTTPVGKTVEQSIHDSIYKAVAGSAADSSQSSPDDSNNKEGATDNPANVNPNTATTEEILNTMKIPQFLFQSVFSQSDFLIRTAQLSAAEAVSKALTGAFMNVLCGIALFLLLLIAIYLLRMLLEMIFKLPLLKEVNKLAGFLAGLVNGVLLSYLLLAVVGALAGFQELTFIRDTIAQSYVYKNFYETNILIRMFTK